MKPRRLPKNLLSPSAGWGRRIVGVLLLGVMLSGFSGAVWHNVATEHVLCDEHERVEHRDSHVDDTLNHQQHATHQEAPVHDDQTPEPHDDSCEVHFWLGSSSVPLPDVSASLLDLPPPAEGREVATSPVHVGTYSPIEILHVSPGLSPPSSLV